MLSIIAVTNHGDGTYTIDFSGPVTVYDGPSAEGYILLYSPGSGLWAYMNSVSQAGLAGILVSEFNGDADCNAVALMPGFTGVSSTDTFPIVTGVYDF